MSIETAISHIPADDRDTWIRIGMAVKHALGDAGWPVWDAWSRTSARYRPRDAQVAWRSLKADGGTTERTLYWLARQNGWQGDTESLPPRAEYRPDNAAAQHAAAAQRARAQVSRAITGPHAYLARKGFPEMRGLILDSELLIPMRDWYTRDIMSVQRIQPDGTKKFLSGARAKGCIYELGRGEKWACEGFATALSIRAALKSMYRDACVVVCFSANNLAHTAPLVHARYVVADNDASGTGEREAKKTGIPYWMPPTTGDANDYHQAAGLRALAAGLRTIL